MAYFRRILAATDFSETSEHALSWALTLGKRLGCCVIVMHAYEVPVMGFPDGGVAATAEAVARVADASRAALERTVAQHEGDGLRLEAVLRNGAAPEEIARVAEELDVDLIVLGTHGRHGLVRALLGSVAERVMRMTHRPVLTVRRVEQERRGRAPTAAARGTLSRI